MTCRPFVGDVRSLSPSRADRLSRWVDLLRLGLRATNNDVYPTAVAALRDLLDEIELEYVNEMVKESR
jgi:hypothetical protein